MAKHYLASVPELKEDPEEVPNEDSFSETSDKESSSSSQSEGSDSSSNSDSSSDSESDTPTPPPEMKKRPVPKKGSKTVSKRKIMNEIKQLQNLIQTSQSYSRKRKASKKYRRPEQPPESHLFPSQTTPVTEHHARRTHRPPEESFAHGQTNTPPVPPPNSRYRFI